jgi:hypothetical protein
VRVALCGTLRDMKGAARLLLWLVGGLVILWIPLGRFENAVCGCKVRRCVQVCSGVFMSHAHTCDTCVVVLLCTCHMRKETTGRARAVVCTTPVYMGYLKSDAFEGICPGLSWLVLACELCNHPFVCRLLKISSMLCVSMYL